MRSDRGNRRKFITGAASLIAAVAGPVKIGEAQARKHPASAYMELVARELIAAQNRDTVSGYSAVLQTRADIPHIGSYALGRYRPRLPQNSRSVYYRGVQRWISRYFQEQSRRYRVKTATINPKPRALNNGEFSVKSKVKLHSGARYTISWRVAPRRGSYRVVDAKILGFSMTGQLRSLFVGFLAKRGNTMFDLISILNR